MSRQAWYLYLTLLAVFCLAVGLGGFAHGLDARHIAGAELKVMSSISGGLWVLLVLTWWNPKKQNMKALCGVLSLVAIAASLIGAVVLTYYAIAG